jgi:uncharacterized protein (TIGR00725 family)
MPELAGFTVGVMGSGRDEHEELATPLGALLAGLQVNLLTGAGKGVMTAVSRAYLDARTGRGISIGIVPAASEDDRSTPRAGYPNPYVELPIRTHLPVSGDDGQSDLSRNHINILSSDAIVALPGRGGTASEAALAIRYEKPIIAFAQTVTQLQDFDGTIPVALDLDTVESFLKANMK